MIKLYFQKMLNKIDELEKTPLKGAKFEVVFTENNKELFFQNFL